MTQPVYGLTIRESNVGARPMIKSDFSTLGLVQPRDGASAAYFPANMPVAFNSSDILFLANCGNGALKRSLTAINSQLMAFQSAARVVVVVVENGLTDTATIANLIGDAGAGTGLHALLKAGQMCKVVPRVIAVPEYTGATTQDEDGHTIANPVCAALPPVLEKLLAVGVVSGPKGGAVAQYLAWRETLASDRLLPADAWAVVSNGETREDLDGAAIALGLFARVDFKHAGLPGWSIAGQQVYGISGLKTYRTFSLTDGATEGQELLAAQISTLVAGELAGDTSVDSSGYVWTGVWSASTDPKTWFYNKRRLKDFVHLALIKSMRKRLGVENVTPAAIKDVLNDMMVIGSEMLRNKCSVGFKVDFVGDSNSPEELEQGRFVVLFADEKPAPIAHVTIDSQNYPQALTVELATVIAQASTLAPQYAQ